MKKIRILNITFTADIAGYEVPAFRGAIIKKVGQENLLFHNHLSENDFLYKYPLIQYKKINRQAGIMCIEYGVEEIHKYFDKKDWDIKIGERWIEMKIANLNMNQFNMQVWNHQFNYNIKNWIALNKNNYPKFLEIKSDEEKISFLENVMKGNILSFAKGIDWTIDKPIEIKIKEIKNQKLISYKGNKLMGFDADFNSNVFLPNYIGLGKGVSLGFGIVKSLRLRSEQTN